jgi:4-amino-4-deoxy-L-arabinose transferase-like glycosyltransferase
MTFAQALHEWHEFFFLIGTAGATLVALLFVAVSLGTGHLTFEHQAPTRTFISPVVIHFTSVFFISAISLVPSHHATFFAVLIAATALIGVAVSTYITVQILRTNMTDYLEDRLAYGVLPATGYLALLAASAMILYEWEAALDVLGGALLLLTIINIRNAWDLTLSMVRRQTRAKRRRR